MKAKRAGKAETQGITTRSVAEERRQQKKLAPRPNRRASAESPSSGGKRGMRSDSRKRATAHRGGIAPGKTRAKAGAWGREQTA